MRPYLYYLYSPQVVYGILAEDETHVYADCRTRTPKMDVSGKVRISRDHVTKGIMEGHWDITQSEEDLPFTHTSY